MTKPLSQYSVTPYMNKYGTWRKALEAFVEYINSDLNQTPEVEEDVQVRSIVENANEATGSAWPQRVGCGEVLDRSQKLGSPS